MTSTTISLPNGTPLLRLALRLDAVVTAANGAAYLALAGPLHDGLGVSEAALRGVGAFLMVFGLAVWLTAAGREVPRRAVAAIVVVNAVWALESVALVALGILDDPTTLGALWVVLQALTVGGFAVFQAVAARRV